MNLEDRLRVAADAAIGSPERTRAGDGLERLYADYEGRMRNPLQRTAFDDITQNAQFGPAAYALGVHYIVQDKLDEAEYWMRFAAECDIGDAALRLAQLCELRAVRYFNRSDDDSVLGKLSYEHSVEARYWYGRAEAAGYIGGRSGMLSAAEQPTEPLDCCDHLALKNSLREAECVVEAAHEEALAVVRQARRDAQQIVDDARAEVEALATRRSALTAQMAQLRSMLEGLAGLVEKGTGRRPGVLRRGLRTIAWRRANGVDRHSLLSAEMEYFVRIVAGVESALNMQLQELPSRTSVARAIISIDPEDLTRTEIPADVRAIVEKRRSEFEPQLWSGPLTKSIVPTRP